jgi:ketosteroid isomerase-like protein
MERNNVADWIKAYMHAWETYSPEAIGALFTEDATYSFHPYDEPVTGRQAIIDAWLKDPDAPGTFRANYVPIAVDGDVAVVTGRSTYFKDSSRTEKTKEWDNLFVIEFGKDGCCRSFREWYVAPRGQAD